MIPKSVRVVWFDHHISLEAISREDAAKLKPMERVSSGFLWAETDDGVILTMDWSPSQPDVSDPHLYIDRRTIKAIVPLFEEPPPPHVEFVDDD